MLLSISHSGRHCRPSGGDRARDLALDDIYILLLLFLLDSLPTKVFSVTLVITYISQPSMGAHLNTHC